MAVNVLSIRIGLSYQVNVMRFHRLWKKIKRCWRRLVTSPARSNESLSLELSRAWKPVYRRSACRFCVGKNPSVVFLAETWTDKVRLEHVQRHIQFKNLFVVPCCNKAKGLAILWKEGFPLEVVKYSKNYIDSVINKGKENA